MAMITSRLTGQQYDAEEWALRVDLAAAFRLAVQFDWHESVGNHFSAAVGEEGKTFLLNPKWKHFATVRASDLLLLNADDPEVMQSENAPDPSAWCIHGSVHAALPHAKVILHCHPPYATALCGLKNPDLQPIDLNTARFFKRIAVDLGFSGITDDEDEGKRIAEALGDKSIMLMGNHGVTVVGETVAAAFEDLYYLERSAKTMVLAYSTGQALNVMSDDMAEHVAQQWQPFVKGLAAGHFEYLKSTLDQQDPSYSE